MPEEFDAGTGKAKNIMDSFIEALYGRSEETIPEEYDWFAPLLGDWEFDYKDKFIDGDRSRPQRQLKGEWIFRRVLNGIGIEDMFICPSRATRETSPQPDGEYGVGLRIYNSKTQCYDMVYACKSKFTNLCFTMENGILTGTVLENPNRKWRFVERNENTFHWQNIIIQENGDITVNCEVFGKRKSEEA